MKIGDIVVLRQLYDDPKEYIIGEVVSDVMWKPEEFHQVPTLLLIFILAIPHFSFSFLLALFPSYYFSIQKQIPGMGDMSVRLVQWHFIDVPYYKLTLTEKNLVRYLCGEFTMSQY